jgi:hypothetical protein
MRLAARHLLHKVFLMALILLYTQLHSYRDRLDHPVAQDFPVALDLLADLGALGALLGLEVL